MSLRPSFASSPCRRRAPLVLIALVMLLGLVRPAAAKPTSIWTGVAKIVAIGDLHGDFEHFVRLLRGTDLVDGDLKWTGGKSHLVQMGDIMDRGDDARKIFDLIRRLEKEAEAAGGWVHMLLGNHEEMNLMGRSIQYEGYVTVQQFIDFLPDRFKAAEARRAGGKVSNSRWKELMTDPDSEAVNAYHENFLETYGRWIAEHNVAIKINTTVFVHGGLTESFAAMGLQAVNDLFHSEIQRVFRGEEFRPRILFQPGGPLWNRDLASTDETPEYKARLDRILASLKAERIVVAHTPTAFRGRVEDMQRYEGKVWVIDTGISSSFHGRVWALVIKDGDVSVSKRD